MLARQRLTNWHAAHQTVRIEGSLHDCATPTLIGRILRTEAHHALKLESDRNRHSLRAHVRDKLTTADAEEHPAPWGDAALWLGRFAGIFL